MVVALVLVAESDRLLAAWPGPNGLTLPGQRSALARLVVGTASPAGKLHPAWRGHGLACGRDVAVSPSSSRDPRHRRRNPVALTPSPSPAFAEHQVDRLYGPQRERVDCLLPAFTEASGLEHVAC